MVTTSRGIATLARIHASSPCVRHSPRCETKTFVELVVAGAGDASGGHAIHGHAERPPAFTAGVQETARHRPVRCQGETIED